MTVKQFVHTWVIGDVSGVSGTQFGFRMAMCQPQALRNSDFLVYVSLGSRFLVACMVNDLASHAWRSRSIVFFSQTVSTRLPRGNHG